MRQWLRWAVKQRLPRRNWVRPEQLQLVMFHAHLLAGPKRIAGTSAATYLRALPNALLRAAGQPHEAAAAFEPPLKRAINRGARLLPSLNPLERLAASVDIVEALVADAGVPRDVRDAAVVQ